MQVKNACDGDLDKIKSVVKLGTNVDNSIDNRTPLMKASSDGYLEIVDFLIKKGANVNARNRLGDSPLILVAPNCDMDKDIQLNIVELLLNAGADVNAQDNYGNTVLMLANECNFDLNSDTNSNSSLLEQRLLRAIEDTKNIQKLPQKKRGGTKRKQKKRWNKKNTKKMLSKK